MVKMITLLKRKPGISREEFSKYWLHPHGDIILRNVPGNRKYIQNPALIKGDREYAYDGVAEGWFDDMDALRKALKVLQGDIIAEDEEKFLDRSKSTGIVIVNEREVELLGKEKSRGDFGMAKMFVLLKRKPGVSREEFSKYWLHPHGDIIVKTVPGIRKYIQNPALIKGDREYAYDGIAESWFNDMDALRNALKVMASPAGEIIKEDEEKFLDRSKMTAIIVDGEREVKL